MRQDELPERWQTRVTDLALRLSKGRHRSLGASGFAGESLRITFPDGSSVFFKHAFAVCDDPAGEIAVFTEHCGHHIFPAKASSSASKSDR
jgi:hypothetical protein